MARRRAGGSANLVLALPFAEGFGLFCAGNSRQHRGLRRIVIRVLGPVEVLDGTDVLDIGSPRHREVLAALVVETGRVVSTEA
uniref:hypothetical protein n=1 Tax=Nocardioides sp. TaxID=35761 RepID=UPI0035626688